MVIRATDGASRLALEATALAKRYGTVTALSDVTLAVPAGCVTALVGPNAAGKSTLLKTWVGFERPSAGFVRVGGQTPSKARAAGAIGYVPQQPAVYRDLSVEDHLNLARHLRPGFNLERARSRLDDLGIASTSRGRELSGGQAAQVGLAMALGTEAPILLLDEPLASLDPLARLECLDVVRESVRDRGTTVMLSSHVVSDIAQIADRLVVLGVGHVLLDAAIEEALDDHGVAEQPPDGWLVVSRLPTSSQVLVRRTSEAGPPAPRRATLEELVLGYLTSGRSQPAGDRSGANGTRGAAS